MGIVAIGALDQPFIHPVMKWPGELRLYVQMARETKLRRCLFQQKIAFLAVVRVVAIRARNAALQVGGTTVIVLLVRVLVAIQAARADLRR